MRCQIGRDHITRILRDKLTACGIWKLTPMGIAIADLEPTSVALIPRLSIMKDRVLRLPERRRPSTDLNLCMRHGSPRWIAAINNDEIGIGV